MKWALRAALFSPKDGKDPQKPSKYTVNNGINYGGIKFPTPVKQIDNDPSKLKIYIMYLDTNIIYSYSTAMSKPLLTRDFKRECVMPTEEDILQKKRKRKEWMDS